MIKPIKNIKNAFENVIVENGSNGPAVEDIQRRLAQLGYLKDSQVDTYFGPITGDAVRQFCEEYELKPIDYVTEKVWSKLVDATFKLGDRNLFLSMPYFHGNDVLELQHALGALGFFISHYDGIFGPSTERALRIFQVNMGLPSDGIAGSQTYAVLKNLAFTWSEKQPIEKKENADANSFWRASEVLERHSICLFGTDDFSRDVAKRISNLARATNPFSKVLSSDAYSVAPSPETILLHIILPDNEGTIEKGAPRCLYDETESDVYRADTEDNTPEDRVRFIKRLVVAIPAAKKNKPPRLTIELPGTKWWDAGEDRSAQHFAITILDAMCAALETIEKQESK